MSSQKNVLGGPLSLCCSDPLTGFYRDGHCHTGREDVGQHTICTQVTQRFLEFSAAMGNDLSTPVPEYGFAGLKPGNKWCLCAERWKEAFAAGIAPPVVLAATNATALNVVGLSALMAHAIDVADGK